MCQRIESGFNFPQILGLCASAEYVGIHHVEIVVERNQIGLLDECLPHIRNVGTSHHVALGLHVAKTFSGVHSQHKMLFVCRRFEFSGVGQYDLRIFIPVGRTINHDSVEHTVFLSFLLHENVVSRNLTVEDTFWDFQLRRLLLHGVNECIELLLRLRSGYVLKIK